MTPIGGRSDYFYTRSIDKFLFVPILHMVFALAIQHMFVTVFLEISSDLFLAGRKKLVDSQITGWPGSFFHNFKVLVQVAVHSWSSTILIGEQCHFPWRTSLRTKIKTLWDKSSHSIKYPSRMTYTFYFVSCQGKLKQNWDIVNVTKSWVETGFDFHTMDLQNNIFIIDHIHNYFPIVWSHFQFQNFAISIFLWKKFSAANTFR